MLLFIILVIAMVALIIYFATLTVRKKNPKFIPPEVKDEPDLNKLEHLVSSVKKTQQPEQEEKTAEQAQNEETQEEQDNTEDQNEQEDEQNSEQQNSGKRPRGTPPKKPPTLNLRQAMKTKQFLDRKG